MPRYFQNYGDPESESLEKPKLELPSDYDSLSHSKQIAVRETIRKRVIHYLYAILTSRLNPEHYNAIFNQSAVVRQRLFEFAVIEDIIHLGAEQEEADTAMEQLREAVGVGVDGWVSNNDFEASKGKVQEVKAKLLEMCDDPLERTKLQDHFPFDGFDEEA
ncbi:uncharacterized protein ASPGLDRAFT_59611 [Aspergillus glaucus CBS 516.65]|uniref:Uncharacterized protein n=1 Tax=Aspergillus glaucus CBS 516.65 TaxID=1160497 RepID=A0A1L9VDT9_ASPGL|nr:hypothetical protein ASPGLDRAFT_59611 [Aspergillus glaucus CBS 516.65]OJJ82063.1 hypothetical protein ASPGLDRAFT_59611 [Aspergillus glaucus CBS 516.65]